MSWAQAVATQFEAGFPPEAPRQRTVGREAEHPLAQEDGQPASALPLLRALADAGLGRPKWEGDLLVAVEGDAITYSAEVGLGTIEVITCPCADLHALRARYEDGMAPLLRLAGQEGLKVLGYGCQPVAAPTPSFMTPKQRYGVLLDRIGPDWLWFTLTASDQLHVAVGRDEWLAQTRLANALTPAVVALFANSSVALGQDQQVCSFREASMGRIALAEARHGMPLRPPTSAEDYVGSLGAHEHLVRRDGDALVGAQGPFSTWAERSPPTLFSDFLLHEHYVWNSGRPRSVHGTLEWRAACQQPWADRGVLGAFGLGAVQAGPRLAAWLDQRVDWPTLRAWHQAAVVHGLAAPEPVSGLLAGILDHCAEGLAERGLGEERELEPLYRRLSAGRNPAQQARAAFSEGGASGLVAAVALPS